MVPGIKKSGGGVGWDGCCPVAGFPVGCSVGSFISPPSIDSPSYPGKLNLVAFSDREGL